MKPPKYVTLVGLLISLSAVLVDPSNTPWMVELLGAHAGTKVAAFGAIIAALGRALLAKPAVPVVDDPPADVG